MKIIKLKETNQFDDIKKQAKKIGWYILGVGFLIAITGFAIFYSTLHSLGILGLIPSFIGAIIMFPGLALMGWGWHIIKIK